MAVPEEDDDDEGDGEESAEADEEEREIRTAGVGGFITCVCNVLRDV